MLFVCVVCVYQRCCADAKTPFTDYLIEWLHPRRLAKRYITYFSVCVACVCVVCCLLLVACCLLLVACCLLRVAYCLLLVACCLLLVVCCLLLVAMCVSVVIVCVCIYTICVCCQQKCNIICQMYTLYVKCRDCIHSTNNVQPFHDFTRESRVNH
jgi:hypothetical protein